MSSVGNAGSSIDLASENICDRIQIEDRVKARAKQIALEAVDAMPAAYKKACMAGALYAACQEAHQPIGLKDIHAIANGPTHTEIVRAKLFIKENMDLKLQPSDGISYLGRFCIDLGMGENDKKAAKEAFDNLMKIEHCHTERLKAASIAYLMHRIAAGKLIRAFDLDLFMEIGMVANLEPSTIRNFYREKVIPSCSQIVPWAPVEEM